MIEVQFEFGELPISPLILFVHGKAGHLSIMSPFYRAVPAGFHRLSVQAPVPDSRGGFSWWEDGESHQSQQRAEDLQKIVEDQIQEKRIHPQRLFAMGFSQGAAILSLIAQKFPQKWHSIALLAGFVIPDETFPNPPLPSILMINGLQDETVGIEKARRGFQYLQDHGFGVEMVEEPVGHKVGIDGMKRLRSWLADEQGN